ncbi:replication protein a 70 kda DNA-binding subunit a [Anaeramoeba flamelloides]|uniref:Replication protein A subunit n=1 Tax=Anaeramoeba flamelloides TaxID=1746091 RepID=A0AAV8A175_9EUKA|nr:replication protein a 70 kda DNA-binding subunit a [Anaeramoeba flamelloides]
MTSQLTDGSIPKIFKNEECVHPILQVTDLEETHSKSKDKETVRYRLKLSDGKFYLLATLNRQLNEMVINEEIKNFSFIKLLNYQKTVIKNTDFLLVSNLESVSTETAKIGEPTQFTNETEENEIEIEKEHEQEQETGKEQEQTTFKTQPLETGITLLRNLNTYNKNWKIKVRVTNKTEPKIYNKNGKQGQVMYVTLVDSNGDEMRATMFNDNVTKFNKVLQVSKCYYISGGMLKPADRRFSSIQSDYEINFNNYTTITLCTNTSDLPKEAYHYKKLSEIEKTQNGMKIDVLGIIAEVGELIEVKSRTGMQLKKRECILADQYMRISCNFWGEIAEKNTFPDNPVIILKGANVGEYLNKKNISASSSVRIILDPEINEAQEIRDWWYRGGGKKNQEQLGKTIGKSFSSNTNWIENDRDPLSNILNLNLGGGEKADYITSKVTITHILHDENNPVCYPSCTFENCTKKVTLQGSHWVGEKCNHRVQKPNYRYNPKIRLTDSSSSIYATAFNQICEDILGAKAEHIETLKQQGRNDEFNEIFNKAVPLEGLARIRITESEYEGKTFKRSILSSFKPITDYVLESKKLIQQINKISEN